MPIISPRGDIGSGKGVEEDFRMHSDRHDDFLPYSSGRSSDTYHGVVDESPYLDALFHDMESQSRSSLDSAWLHEHHYESSIENKGIDVFPRLTRSTVPWESFESEEYNNPLRGSATNGKLRRQDVAVDCNEAVDDLATALGHFLKSSLKGGLNLGRSEFHNYNEDNDSYIDGLRKTSYSPAEETPRVAQGLHSNGERREFRRNVMLQNEMAQFNAKRIDANKKRRQRLQQYENIATEIFPWLYLSGAGPPRDANTINRYNIDLIINCAGEVVPNAFEPRYIQPPGSSPEARRETPRSGCHMDMDVTNSQRDPSAYTTAPPNRPRCRGREEAIHTPRGSNMTPGLCEARYDTDVGMYSDGTVPYDDEEEEEDRSQLTEPKGLDSGQRMPFPGSMYLLSQSFDAAYHLSHVVLERKSNYTSSKALAASFSVSNSHRDPHGHEEYDKLQRGKVLSYLTLRLCDGPSENIACLFPFVVSVIEKARKTGKVVLIHCHQGVSRSAAFVIAYTMWAARISQLYAHEYVLKRREIVSPNIGFICQLLEWEGFLTTTVGSLDESVGGRTEGVTSKDIVLSYEEEMYGDDLDDVVLHDFSDLQDALPLPRDTLMTFEFHSHARGCYTIGPFFNTEDYETNSYLRVKLPPSLSMVRCDKNRRQQPPSFEILQRSYPKPMVFVTRWHRLNLISFRRSQALMRMQNNSGTDGDGMIGAKLHNSAEYAILPAICVSAPLADCGMVRIDRDTLLSKKDFTEHLHKELHLLSEISSRYSTANQCHILRYLVQNGLLKPPTPKQRNTQIGDCCQEEKELDPTLSTDGEDEDMDRDPVVPDLAAGFDSDEWQSIEDSCGKWTWRGSAISHPLQHEILSVIVRHSAESHKLLPVCGTPILWKDPRIEWYHDCFCTNTRIVKILAKVCNINLSDGKLIPDGKCYCQKQKQQKQGDREHPFQEGAKYPSTNDVTMGHMTTTTDVTTDVTTTASPHTEFLRSLSLLLVPSISISSAVSIATTDQEVQDAMSPRRME